MSPRRTQAIAPVYSGGSIPSGDKDTITPEDAAKVMNIELKKQVIFVIGVCAGCLHGNVLNEEHTIIAIKRL
jgi:hypothetical protein